MSCYALEYQENEAVYSSICAAASDSQLVTSSNSFSIAWIAARKIFGYYGNTEQEKHREKMLYAARLFRHLPPWLYSTYPWMTKRLGLEPWRDPIFKDVSDVFKKARGILFSSHSNNKQYFVNTPDGVQLDAILFPGTSKQVIYFVPGVTESYESCSVDGVCRRLVRFFQKQFPGINVFMMNPRGVGRSEGVTTPSTLPVDVFTGYEFLIRNGFGLRQILGWGHSLGGCYITQGAALVQQWYPNQKINVVIDRSFLHITDVVQSWKHSFGSPKLNALVDHYFHSEHLQMSSREAVCALKGSVVAIFSKGDTIIRHDVGFIQKSCEEKLKIKNLHPVELADEAPKSRAFLDQHHQRAFSSNEADTIGIIIREIFTEHNSQEERKE